MLHPSYIELIEKINKYAEENGYEKLTSRYNVVAMAYRRAHEIISGDEPLVDYSVDNPLSKAIQEIYANKVNVVKKN